MKIKSINDVITNSSDEVYIIKSNKTAQEILDDLKAHQDGNEYCSGMGGILTVKTHDDFVGNDQDYYQNWGIPEGFAQVTIDQGYKALHDYIRPKHEEVLENTIIFSDNLTWLINYLEGNSVSTITKESIEAIPKCKNNLEKVINKFKDLYENIFNF